MRIEGVRRSTKEYNGVQKSTTEYNGVSLRKEDLMCAVVIVRLL
jgi:hypothetical protein